jgi:hypothetical protein
VNVPFTTFIVEATVAEFSVAIKSTAKSIIASIINVVAVASSVCKVKSD